MADELGNRLKRYEARETERVVMNNLPIYARLDGRSFSKFTRGMERPYDIKMSELMVATAKAVLEEFGATVVYTQSDEISVGWHITDPKVQMMFDGKIQKLTSTLASFASVFFAVNALKIWPERTEALLPHFDCRLFELPNLDEAANAFRWRVLDATKNSITMAASSVYSHTELQGKTGKEKQEMLFAKGINFNDYPSFFKRGTFVRKRKSERVLTEKELNHIPEQHRPAKDSTFVRSEAVSYDLPPADRISNFVEVLFFDATPVPLEPRVLPGS